jgi:predicted GNAT family N-acyltransferase
MMNVVVRKVISPEDFQICLSIRLAVFVRGQKVPLEEDLDGKDVVSDHYLLWLNEEPVGVARVRYLDEVAKIERVAILEEHQGKGLGKAIMNKILSDLKQDSRISFAKLSAQTYAIPFYEKLGFMLCSDEYMDSGIPHRDMILSF